MDQRVLTGVFLAFWGAFKIIVGVANYGSAGSWWYFDVWFVFLGSIVIIAAGALLAEVRPRVLGGLGATLLVLDRLAALTVISHVIVPFVVLQVIVAVCLGYVVFSATES